MSYRQASPIDPFSQRSGDIAWSARCSLASWRSHVSLMSMGLRGANICSRMSLTFAVVEHQTLRIDELAPTGPSTGRSITAISTPTRHLGQRSWRSLYTSRST